MLEEPRVVLGKVMKRIKSKNSMSNRGLADEMHRQADNLHKKGDYETALILYHRAASLCPRDINHILSAKKTESEIITTTKTKPRETRRVYLKKRKLENDEILDTIRCNSKKTNPRKMISQSNWELAKVRGSSTSAAENLSTLRRYFTAENWRVCLRIGNSLLASSKKINNSVTETAHYHIIIHHYLTLSYMSISRHDYAINHATKILKKSINLNNNKLILKSIILLSRVNLKFGHYNALIHAMNNLLKIYMHEETIKAWLLNKIANSYFEMRLYKESLYVAEKFSQFPFNIDSVKWLYHGKLLGGQVLIKLARYNEALESLIHAKKYIFIYQNNIKIKLNEFGGKNKSFHNNYDKLNSIFNYNKELIEYVDDLMSVVENFTKKKDKFSLINYENVTRDKTRTCTFTTTNDVPSYKGIILPA